MFLQTIAHFGSKTPTIKFRAALKYAKKGTAGKKGGNAIFDYDLPPRYQRKQLSPQEIDSINTGGATSVIKYSK